MPTFVTLELVQKPFEEKHKVGGKSSALPLGKIDSLGGKQSPKQSPYMAYPIPYGHTWAYLCDVSKES